VGIAGNLSKMRVEAGQPVKYTLALGDNTVEMNALLGQRIVLRYTGDIHCVACGRKTSKSFNQGYCFPCMRSRAECDSCIVKPEQCHFDAGTCREPEWGKAHCMRTHYVYLANSSGIKVGITRETQIPIRWLDQGAVQALPIFKVSSRFQSGLMEVLMKEHVADRTDWRALLKGNPEPADLGAKRDELFERCADGIAGLLDRFGGEAIAPLANEPVRDFEYPVQEFPAKISAHNFDKTPEVSGTLLGIKGQYLILDTGVLNIRKFSGYGIVLEA
jgi:hypothetical protein